MAFLKFNNYEWKNILVNFYHLMMYLGPGVMLFYIDSTAKVFLLACPIVPYFDKFFGDTA